MQENQKHLNIPPRAQDCGRSGDKEASAEIHGGSGPNSGRKMQNSRKGRRGRHQDTLQTRRPTLLEMVWSHLRSRTVQLWQFDGGKNEHLHVERLRESRMLLMNSVFVFQSGSYSYWPQIFAMRGTSSCSAFASLYATTSSV